MAKQQQHVDLYRKVAIRKALLTKAQAGPAYIPFIGDGDLADALYRDRTIYGADLDIERVKTAQGRGFTGEIRQADCDNYPFADVQETFAVADLDSFAFPYAAFRTFWTKAEKTDPFVCFFTDGQRLGIKRSGNFIDPDGAHRNLGTWAERRPIFNFYWKQVIEPWFTEYIKPWHVQATQFYLRGQSGMLYWGAVVGREAGAVEVDEEPTKHTFKKFNQKRREVYLQALRGGMRRTAAAEAAGVSFPTVWAAMKEDAAFADAVDVAEVEACDPIENALREAAQSGNVPAIQTWLYGRSKGRWKPPNVKTEVSGPDGGPIEHEVKLDLSSLSDEELESLECIARKLTPPTQH